MNDYLQELADSYASWEEKPQADNKLPQWLTGRGEVRERIFCDEFLKENTLCSVDGVFYDLNGPLKDERPIRQKIYEKLKPYCHTGLPRKVDTLLETLRYECEDKKALSTDLNNLHFSNGTYIMDRRTFVMLKYFCRHRFPVAYDPHAPKPEKWLQFLHDLLEDEDILTLQEYMGYCLFPITRAQKMLMIVGSGGEGKSRIGVVMKALWGRTLCHGSLDKVEHNAFARADLENMLVMVDDDMKMEAFRQTNNIKTIITAETPMDLEKKGKQSYQGQLFVRFLGFGNGNLQALHDRSYGFFRRQIILRAKPRSADRVDDPFLADELKKELQGILLWCIEGWERLFLNSFRFTLSQGARQNMEASICESCNIGDFFRSEGYFLLDPEGCATSRALYHVYQDWCDDNSLSPLGQRTFSNWVMEHASGLRLTYRKDVSIGNGKFARGYLGIRMLPRM